MKCDRCSRTLAVLARTMAGDAVCWEPCECPCPVCPFCYGPLDTQGRCQGVDCFMSGHPIPVPAVRTDGEIEWLTAADVERLMGDVFGRGGFGLPVYRPTEDVDTGGLL